MKDLLHKSTTKAQQWLTPSFDSETQQLVQNLLKEDEKELIESFFQNLEFGTGGLRGIMGVGTNRMNKYTVGMATQGLANYLIKAFPELPQIKMAIAYDCRNNSRYFADIVANVLSGNNIKVFLFDALRPTPELSFAIRHLKCQSGIVITASHNPKEYNGYKVYWNDGGQVTPPHDKNIIDEVNKINSPDQVIFEPQKELIELIGKTIDNIYLESILSLIQLSPEAIKKHSDIKMVYTPLHGTGVGMVPEALRRMGFTNLLTIKEQMVNDGNFPTVESPNPEEPSALKMAIDLANKEKADLVFATDPDADRVGIAVRNHLGEMEILNGNQTNSILTYYLLSRWKDLNKLTGKEYIVKTIVSTDLMVKIAESFGVETYNCYTGFKYIAEVIRRWEGKKTFIGGGEESFGYNVGEFVRDKDAVVTSALIAEVAAWAKSKGQSIYDLLLDIYCKYGFYKDKQISLVRKGIEGMQEIQNMMQRFRVHPPVKILGQQVSTILDYEKLRQTNVLEGDTKKIDQPYQSNVLQFITTEGILVSVRPSGTEPKIKFYFSVCRALRDKSEYVGVNQSIEQMFIEIEKELIS